MCSVKSLNLAINLLFMALYFKTYSMSVDVNLLCVSGLQEFKVEFRC